MDIFKLLLAIHIIAGSMSLPLGLYIILTKKGTVVHKKSGNAYFYLMLINSIMAIPMSFMHPNYFLFLISVFTIYMLLTGVRYMNKKNDSKIHANDWVLTFVILLFALVFIGLGIFNIVKANYFGIVIITFGCIGLLFSYQDYINFKGKSKIKNFYLTTHIQRMTGSYISSTTAFLVVNNTILPSILAWLLPTILIVPLIITWTTKNKIEHKSGV